MGSPNKEKTQNLGSKPIIVSMKQIVQGNGQETSMDIKLRKGLFYCHNCLMQDSDYMNFLESH
jgi:hypothetical protein